MRTTRLVVLIAIAAGLVLVPASALADSIDFQSGGLGESGTVQWSGGTLTANSTIVSAIFGSFSVPMTGLSFETGPFTLSGMGDINFGSGGSITASGPCGGPCFLGAFVSSQWVWSTGGDQAQLFAKLILGDVDPALLSLLGLSGTPSVGLEGSMQALFQNVTYDGSTLTGDYLSGDLGVTPVPEPPLLLLVGVGMLVLALLARKLAA